MGIEVIQAVAACVAAVAACAVFLQIKQGERHLRFDVLKRVIEMMEGTGNCRRLFRETVSKDSPPNKWSELGSEEKTFRILVQTYDELGLLVKHGTVPISFVLDLYARPLVEAWHRLGPAIEAESDERKQPGHRNKFAILAMAAKAHRDKSHKGEESFEIERKIIDRWEREDTEWPPEVRRTIRRRLRGLSD